MFGFFRNLRKKISSSRYQEISDYKESCDELVGKYEHLLKQISEYMQENQVVLRSFEQNGRLLPQAPSDQVQLNTFSLLSIKDELVQITSECESLLSRGSSHLNTNTAYEKTIEVLLSQLRELRRYSEQIEEALGEFEDKLLKMEEVLSEHSLCN